MNEWILVRKSTTLELPDVIDSCASSISRGFVTECHALSRMSEYGQKFPTVFKCLVSNTGQSPTKIKQTNQNKQMPAAMKVEFFTRTSVYRPYHWTVFRSEFPGFVWPVKSCIECHSPFISFITDQNSHGFISLWVVSLTSARINAIASLCHHL